MGTELLNDFLEGENGEPRHQLGFERTPVLCSSSLAFSMTVSPMVIDDQIQLLASTLEVSCAHKHNACTKMAAVCMHASIIVVDCSQYANTECYGKGFLFMIVLERVLVLLLFWKLSRKLKGLVL